MQFTTIIFNGTLVLSLLTVATKDIFTYLQLWQRKEYRLDKMFDFITTKEALPFFLNIFIILKFFFLISFALIETAPKEIQIYGNLLLWLFYITLIIEAGSVGVRFLIKKLAKPIFTKKAILLTSLSIIPTLILPFIWTELTVLNLVLSIWINLFFTPYYISLIMLALAPVDIYLKNRIFKKALNHRKTLENLKVIAISGSYGKTTTKDILHKILEKPFRAEKTLKNQNTALSCAYKTLNLGHKNKIFVCEIGAYKVGDGAGICKFVLPNQAIITGLNNQHFSLFGSELNIVRAESESLEFLKPGDKTFINYNSPLCHKIKIPEDIKVVSYGIDDNNANPEDFNYFAKDIFFDGKLTHFTLVFEKKEIRMKTNLISRGNVQNITCAIACAHQNGIGFAQITPILLELENPEGTLNIEKKSWGSLIDDSRNANKDGVINALELMKNFSKSKKIIIFDEIIELGKEAKPTHKEIAKKILEINPDLLILTGKSCNNIIMETLRQSKFSISKVIQTFPGEDYDGVAKIVQKMIEEGDISKEKTIILAEGYRSKHIKNRLEKFH